MTAQLYFQICIKMRTVSKRKKKERNFSKRGDDKVFPLVVKGLILSDNVSINHTNENDMLINADTILKK